LLIAILDWISISKMLRHLRQIRSKTWSVMQTQFGGLTCLITQAIREGT